MQLLVLAHANRAAGGRSVGLNFLQALAEVGNGVKLTAVLPVGCGYEALAERYGLRVRWFRQDGSFTKRFWFDAITLPREVLSLGPDAILALGNIGLLNPPVPQAVLIHDAHYVYPRRHYGQMTVLQHLRYAVQIRQLRQCIARSSLVYCQTPAMLQRVQRLSGSLPAAKVLPNCLPALAANVGARIALPPAFDRQADRFRLICLSRYYPHKNLEGIVETFRAHREQLKGVVLFLTIAADQHRNARRLLERVERLGLSDQIINLGPVDPPMIPAYLARCQALLFPTKMESFSVTYLEAMAAGLPILTSDLDFARGVCGEAALYFDPWAGESMARAIVQVRDDARLREQLAARGRHQVATAHNRSWKDVAGLIVSDLQQVVGHPAPLRN